mmetsp:Transcript_31097/g.89187  ORF Transcript_31097/g.89187 Transcript_31097/m.89187 type:complete len:247 (-) Transcript_31097:228-968(-)
MRKCRTLSERVQNHQVSCWSGGRPEGGPCGASPTLKVHSDESHCCIASASACPCAEARPQRSTAFARSCAKPQTPAASRSARQCCASGLPASAATWNHSMGSPKSRGHARPPNSLTRSRWACASPLRPARQNQTHADSGPRPSFRQAAPSLRCASGYPSVAARSSHARSPQHLPSQHIAAASSCSAARRIQLSASSSSGSSPPVPAAYAMASIRWAVPSPASAASLHQRTASTPSTERPDRASRAS